MRAESSWFGAGEEQTIGGRRREDLARRLRIDFFRAVVGATLLGVGVVIGFLTLVVPVPAEFDTYHALLVNAVGLAYTAVAIVIGVRWGRSLASPVLAWLSAGPPPPGGERVEALRFPFAGMKVVGPLWAGAAVVIGTLDAFISSPGYGALVGTTV